MPRAASSRGDGPARAPRRSASPRERSRPAPWHELPKVSVIAFAVPART